MMREQPKRFVLAFLVLVLAASTTANATSTTNITNDDTKAFTERGTAGATTPGSLSSTNMPVWVTDQQQSEPYPSTAGRFIVHCNPTVRAKLDPIIFAGSRNLSHSHDFFGMSSAQNSDDTITTGTRTSCSTRGDRTLYWVPSLYSGKIPVKPARVQAYYTVNDLTRPVPAGLKYVTGAERSSDRSGPVVEWLCAGSGSDRRSVSAQSCQENEFLMAELVFPGCWDGVHLDSVDHRSHLRYVDFDGRCAVSHPVHIPQLTLFLQWSCNVVCGPTRNLSLSSGPTETLHGDIIAGWDRTTLAGLLVRCRDTDCGVIGTLPAAPAIRRQ